MIASALLVVAVHVLACPLPCCTTVTIGPETCFGWPHRASMHSVHRRWQSYCVRKWQYRPLHIHRRTSRQLASFNCQAKCNEPFYKINVQEGAASNKLGMETCRGQVEVSTPNALGPMCIITSAFVETSATHTNMPACTTTSRVHDNRAHDRESNQGAYSHCKIQDNATRALAGSSCVRGSRSGQGTRPRF